MQAVMTVTESEDETNHIVDDVFLKVIFNMKF